MARLSIPTARRVSYAHGYIELGLVAPAAEELDCVVAEDRRSVPVLLARVELHLADGNWAALVDAARTVARDDPAQERAWIGWAYGQRRLTALPDARAVLIEGETHHGATSALLHYNLACYDCQLGDLPGARARLHRAFQLAREFRVLALADPDLVTLRLEIAAMP